VDSFRTTDVRAVLGPLVDLAAEMRVAMVGIMRFNKKLDVTNALLRISDSLAFGATARHVFAAVDDPENKRKLLVRGKNNLARSDIQALAYHFEAKEVAPHIWAPHIVWHEEHVDVSASEAMQAAIGNKAPPPAMTPKSSSKNFSVGGRSCKPISWRGRRPT
jgi:putative DNA primase/helicase